MQEITIRDFTYNSKYVVTLKVGFSAEGLENGAKFSDVDLTEKVCTTLLCINKYCKIK